MSIKIQKGPKLKPSRIAMYAVEGIGKTTLASTFPSPLFLDTEEGSDYVDADSYPTKSIEDLDAAIKYLTTESHEYETVIVDTLDYFETISVRLAAGATCLRPDTARDLSHLRLRCSSFY